MAKISLNPGGLREHVLLASCPASDLLVNGLRRVTLPLSLVPLTCPEQPELTQRFLGWLREGLAQFPTPRKARPGAGPALPGGKYSVQHLPGLLVSVFLVEV